MPDDVVQRSKRNKDKELLSSKTDFRESWLPYQSRWMACWRETCSSSSSHAFEHHVISDAHYKTQKREPAYFVVESMKSKKDSKVSMEMETENLFECITLRRYAPKELDLSSDVGRYAHISISEKEEVNRMRSTMVKNNVKSLDPKAVTSNKLFVKNLQEFSLIGNPTNTHHSMNSDNVTSRMEHFPVFDINRRIDSILSPKKKCKDGNTFGRPLQSHSSFSPSTLTPHVTEFAPEECHFEARCISQTTGQLLRPYKSTKDMLSYGDDLTRSPHLAIHKFECNESTRSNICNREGNDHFICKENFSSTDVTPLNLDMCNCLTHFTSMKQKTKSDHEMIDNDFGSSCSGLKDSSLLTLRDSRPGDTMFPFLVAEHGKAKRNIYGGDLLPIYESIHDHELSKDDAKALEACTTSEFVDNTKDEHLRFSKETQYLLLTKNMGMETSRGDLMMRKSTLSPQVKENDFLEMPVLNSMSRCHFQQAVNSQPLMLLTNGEEVTDKDSTDIEYMDAWNRSSDKTDTIYTDVPQTPTSPEGPTSFYFEKDVARHNLTRSKSRTESTSSPDHSLSHSEKPENNSAPLQEESSSSPELSSRGFKLDNSTPRRHADTSYLEQSNRWIKRLRHYPSDSHSLSAKRFKMADASYQGQAGDSFSKRLNFHNSNSDSSKCLGPLNVTDTALRVRSSSEESKAMNSWIRRWSRQVANHQQIATTVLCEPKISNVVHEKLDGNHFPSITAMALMGKATKNFRPNFQKKGSLMVWNT